MPVTQKSFWVASDGQPYATEAEAKTAEYALCKQALVEAYITKTEKSAKSAAYARGITEEFIDVLSQNGFDVIESMQNSNSNE